MTTFPLTILKTIARPHGGILAAFLLAGVSVSPALAAPAPAATPSAQGSYCEAVKNMNARQLCLAARDQFYKRNFRSALVTMKKAQEAAPAEGIIHAMTARIVLLGLNDAGAAEAELRKALQNGAQRDSVVPLLLQVMVDRHEENALLVEFPDPASGAKGDEVAAILRGRGLALLSLKRLDEAASAMDRAIALRRDTANLIARAKIASEQNNPMLARKMVDAAYELDPKDRSAAMAKLQQIRQSGDAAQIIAFSGKLLGQFPDDIRPRRARIETFWALHQDAKAKAEVDAIVAMGPRSNYAAYYRALLMAHNNQKKEAWTILFALPPSFVRQNPDMAVPIAELAIETGHAEVGGTVLSNALSAAPDLLDARLRLAQLRLTQNSPQSAMSLLSPVKDSPDPRVQKLMGQVQAQIAKNRAF